MEMGLIKCYSVLLRLQSLPISQEWICGGGLQSPQLAGKLSPFLLATVLQMSRTNWNIGKKLDGKISLIQFCFQICWVK